MLLGPLTIPASKRSAKNLFIRIFNYFPILSKAHHLSPRVNIGIFISQFKFHQKFLPSEAEQKMCRLNEEFQATGFRSGDLQRPEAKSFSCFLKLRLSPGCMRMVQKSSSEIFLSFLLLLLFTGLHITSAEITGTAGTHPTPLRFHTKSFSHVVSSALM